MPHYEFVCKECKKTFALIMTLAEYEKGHFTCPKCKSKIIDRYGYHTQSRVGRDGKCPDCRTAIPGVWS